MRSKFILLSLLLAVFPVAAWGNQSANVLCADTGSVMTSGMPSANKAAIVYPFCVITVYFSGTTNRATIYADNTNGVLSNPFTADGKGRGFFFAPLGSYDVVLSGGGMPLPITIANVLLQDVTTINGTFAISGSGPPVAPCVPANAGQTYTNIVNGNVYACTGTAWLTTAATAGAGPPTIPCTAGNVGQTYTDTVAGFIYACDGTIWRATNASISYPGVTTDSANGLLAQGNYGGISIGSSYYASKFPGQSNNGIVLTFADSTKCGASGCVVVADPGYPTTEQPFNFLGARFPSVPLAHYEDRRKGGWLNLFRDPPVSSYTSFGDADVTGCVFNLLTPVAGQSRNNCKPMYLWAAGPGMDNGTPGKGPGGWSTEHGLNILSTINSPGISNPLTSYQTKAGIGDAALYFYMYGYGGAVAGSDEGHTTMALGGGESGTRFAGTITTGGTGATSVKVNCTADCNFQGDGRFLVDYTRGTTGFVTASTNPSGSFTPGTYTTDITVPVSTFWGTLATDVLTPVGTPLGTGYTNMTFSVNSGSGNTGAPVAGDLVCFGGQFHEQSKITSVTGAGPWSVTLPLRHAHEANSWIMANGVCGSFIDFTANDVLGSTGQTLRYPVDLIGSTDANTVRYRYFDRQGPTNNNLGNVRFAQAFTGGAAFVTNTAGIVNFRAAQNASNNPVYFGQATITISNATNALFNGPCTNTFADSSGFLNCTQAASTGLTSDTATVAIGTSAIGNTAFTIVPGAEVLDVLDYVSGNCTPLNKTTPCIDGTFTLEPNTVVWTASDNVENPHHYAGVFTGFKDAFSQYNPLTTAVVGEYISLVGPGTGGAGSAAKKMRNLAPIGTFTYHGGLRDAPAGLSFDFGIFSSGLSMTFAPDPPGSAAISIGCPFSGCTDTAYHYQIYRASGSSGAVSYLDYTPSSKGFAMASNYLDLNATQLLGPVVRARPASPATGTYNSLNSILTFKTSDSGGVDHTVTLLAQASAGFSSTLQFPLFTSNVTKTLATNDVMVASGASHAIGLVPDPGSTPGTTRYLREDATWSGIYLGGATASLGGGALTAGQCSSANVTISAGGGAQVGMGVNATPLTYPGDGFYWLGYVSAANTVTIKVCAAVAGTPTASVYNVKVWP